MALSQLAQQTPGKVTPGPGCTVCQLETELPADEATALRQMLTDPRWRYSALAEALHGEGYDIAQQTIARHVRGLCAARTKLR